MATKIGAALLHMGEEVSSDAIPSRMDVDCVRDFSASIRVADLWLSWRGPRTRARFVNGDSREAQRRDSDRDFQLGELPPIRTDGRLVVPA